MKVISKAAERLCSDFVAFRKKRRKKKKTRHKPAFAAVKSCLGHWLFGQAGGRCEVHPEHMVCSMRGPAGGGAAFLLVYHSPADMTDAYVQA